MLKEKKMEVITLMLFGAAALFAVAGL